MMVMVGEDGKTFHAAGCRFIHDKVKLRTMPASQALREGYTPYVRCIKKYLSESASYDADNHDDAEFASQRDQLQSKTGDDFL
jgi:hypothetical protein